jgi:hypothetical protein
VQPKAELLWRLEISNVYGPSLNSIRIHGRNEPLDVDQLFMHSSFSKRALDEVHERLGTAKIKLGDVGILEKRANVSRG